MKKIVSYLTIISLLLITFSCGGGGSSKGVSPVTISASFKTSSAGSAAMKAQATTTLTTIRYTVTGSGMDTMTDTVPVIGNLVEFTLNVPNGPQRHFLIEALGSDNKVVYSGEAYRDLDGTPITIEITLVPTTPLFNMRDYFPLGQGDTWMDDDYDIETISGMESIDGANAVKMTEEDGDYQLFTNSNGITYYKKYDANDLEGCGWSQSIFIPPITLLPAEVSIGVKYTSNFTTNYTNCRGESKTTTSSAEFTVEGIEDVTVPAGTFKDCLKIKIKFNNMFSDEGQIESDEQTMWLAKGVGTVKGTSIEDTGEDTSELVSATVGGISYGSPLSIPKAEVSVRIAHHVDGYYLDFNAENEFWTINIMSGTVTGPHLGTIDLNYTCSPESCLFANSVFFGQTKPTPGDTYTFTLSYSDGSSETLTDSVYDIGVGFPVLISPQNGEIVETTTPTFSWQPPQWGCAAWYHLLVYDSSGNAIWWPHIPGGTTSAVYNFDGKATQPLMSGESYSWGVNAFDDCLRQNDGHDNFAGAWGGTFTLLVNPPPCPALNITSPSTLSSDTVGHAYTYQIQTSGGQPPITYNLISGSLPPGLNLSSNGLISGTPTTAGSYSFTIGVTDSCATGAQSVQGTFTIQ